jgi:DNA helicase II / ATP-dependent DNA helicase PcrA
MYQQTSLLTQSFLQLNSSQKSNFNPSIYQQAIFDWIKDGSGSCVVNAVPGSGKTTTLVEASKLIKPSKKVKFLAFNKHIVKELKTKLPSTVKTTTIHSMGFSALKLILGQTFKLHENKYNRLISQYLQDHKIKDADIFKKLQQLVNFTQLTLTNYSDLNQLKLMTQHYNIPIFKDWQFYQSAVTEILEQGKDRAWLSISFNDMVWLPNVLNLPIETADFLFVDECQDLNQAQLSLVLNAYKQGTRGLFVGDVNQTIMGFSGSKSDSIPNIIQQTNSIQLPLSICYRCPTSHIELANKVYNVVEPAPNAIKGELEKINQEQVMDYVQAGDLIICRTIQPLVELYFKLIRAGIAVTMKNQDIGQQLIDLLSSIFGQNQNLILSSSRFSQLLNQWFEEKETQLVNNNASSLYISLLEDKIKTLIAIYDGNNCQDIDQCIHLINQLCQVQKTLAVNLTTIHGAKGLEANRVFLLRPDLIPHKSAIQQWEKEQEYNLLFVALTRSKHSLFFCV